MTRRLAIVLLAGALLAGCGGGEDSKAEPEPPSVEEQLGFSQAGDPAAQAKVEEQIAACMKQQGFEYTPVDPVARQAALTGRSGISGDEFDKQFGYGIATLYARGSPQSDPNARIRASLAPAEQRAYDKALTGATRGRRSSAPPTPATSAGSGAAPSGRRTRCSADRSSSTSCSASSTSSTRRSSRTSAWCARGRRGGAACVTGPARRSRTPKPSSSRSSANWRRSSGRCPKASPRPASSPR